MARVKEYIPAALLLSFLLLFFTALIVATSIEAAPWFSEPETTVVEDQVWIDLKSSGDHLVSFVVALQGPEDPPVSQKTEEDRNPELPRVPPRTGACPSSAGASRISDLYQIAFLSS